MAQRRRTPNRALREQLIEDAKFLLTYMHDRPAAASAVREYIEELENGNVVEVHGYEVDLPRFARVRVDGDGVVSTEHLLER